MVGIRVDHFLRIIVKYFAKLDVNNVVLGVVAVNDGDAPTEAVGATFLMNLLGDQSWIECSYDASFRGMYPGIGNTYDPILDIFVP